MTRTGKTVACAGALAVMGLTALLPTASWAGADGRKNTTIALGAAAAWELLHHQTLAGVALGAGAVYAEKKYEDSRRSERDQRDRRYYYGSGRDSQRGSDNSYDGRGDNHDSYRDNNDYKVYGNGSRYGGSDQDSEDAPGRGWGNGGSSYSPGSGGPRYYRSGSQGYASDGNTRYPGGRPTPFGPACDDKQGRH